MQNTLINPRILPIKQWVDNLDPTLQLWLKDYINQKLEAPADLTNVPGVKNYYIFDYRYASEFRPSSELTEQLEAVGAEIMFIYDTIHHNPIQIKPISGTNEANQIAQNKKFWGELMKGYLTFKQNGDHSVRSIIGPASAGIFIYAPPKKEHEIFRILGQADESMVGIEDVKHEIIAGHKVIHAKIDAMG